MRARFVLNEIRRGGGPLPGMGREAMMRTWLESMEVDPGRASLRDWAVDYRGNVNLEQLGMSSLASEEGFRWGDVSGNFICASNDLKDLVGAPLRDVNRLL